MVKEAERRFFGYRGYLTLLALFLLSSVFVLKSVDALIYLGQSYSGWGFFGYGYDDIVSLYYAYPGWIDFMIFFGIFVSLGKGVFGERFKGGAGKGLAVSVALALSLGLVLWENANGIYLLQKSAILVFLLLTAGIFYGIYSLLSKKMGVGNALAIIISAIATYLIWMLLSSYIGFGTGDMLGYIWGGFDMGGIISWILMAVAIYLLIKLLLSLFGGFGGGGPGGGGPGGGGPGGGGPGGGGRIWPWIRRIWPWPRPPRGIVLELVDPAQGARLLGGTIANFSFRFRNAPPNFEDNVTLYASVAGGPFRSISRVRSRVDGVVQYTLPVVNTPTPLRIGLVARTNRVRGRFGPFTIEPSGGGGGGGGGQPPHPIDPGRIKRLEALLKYILQNIKLNNDLIQQLNGRIQALIANIQADSSLTDARELTKKLNEILKRLSDIQKTLNGHRTSLDGLESMKGYLESIMRSLNQIMGELSDVDGLKKYLAGINSSMIKLLESLEKLRKAVKALKSGAKGPFGPNVGNFTLNQFWKIIINIQKTPPQPEEPTPEEPEPEEPTPEEPEPEEPTPEEPESIEEPTDVLEDILGKGIPLPTRKLFAFGKNRILNVAQFATEMIFSKSSNLRKQVVTKIPVAINLLENLKSRIERDSYYVLNPKNYKGFNELFDEIQKAKPVIQDLSDGTKANKLRRIAERTYTRFLNNPKLLKAYADKFNEDLSKMGWEGIFYVPEKLAFVIENDFGDESIKRLYSYFDRAYDALIYLDARFSKIKKIVTQIKKDYSSAR